MASIHIDALLAQLDHTRANPSYARAVIASDGDGTLWRGDIGEALFTAALKDGVLPREACAPLRREALRYGLSSQGGSHDVARRLLHAYEQGRYPEPRAFAMMAWVFVGWTERRLRGYCDDVLDRFLFDDAVRPQMRSLLRWARDHGVPVWLVSASQQQLVECAAQRLALPTECVIAMVPNLRGGRLAAGLAKEATYRDGKVARLRAVESRPLLAAFGDSGFDAPLLDLAHLRVAVFPSAALRAHVTGVPNGFVLDG